MDIKIEQPESASDEPVVDTDADTEIDEPVASSAGCPVNSTAPATRSDGSVLRGLLTASSVAPQPIPLTCTPETSYVDPPRADSSRLRDNELRAFRASRALCETQRVRISELEATVIEVRAAHATTLEHQARTYQRLRQFEQLGSLDARPVVDIAVKLRVAYDNLLRERGRLFRVIAGQRSDLSFVASRRVEDLAYYRAQLAAYTCHVCRSQAPATLNLPCNHFICLGCAAAATTGVCRHCAAAIDRSAAIVGWPANPVWR